MARAKKARKKAAPKVRRAPTKKIAAKKKKPVVSAEPSKKRRPARRATPHPSSRSSRGSRTPSKVPQSQRKKASKKLSSGKPRAKPPVKRPATHPRPQPVRKPARTPARTPKRTPAKKQPRQKPPQQRRQALARKKPRPLSRHPAAVDARRRRADRKALRDQLRAEATGLAPVQGDDERRLAWGWHEMIRERIAEDAFDVELDLTEAGGGHADLTGRAATTERRAIWLSVGRYTPREEIDYATLAHGLSAVANDLLIEAAIHPQRLSQIRVEFHDPESKRSEGDSVLSKIGPWEFVISDLLGELVGASYESPTEGSLAYRYDQTIAPRFYIFFSEQLVKPKMSGPWNAVPRKPVKKSAKKPKP